MSSGKSQALAAVKQDGSVLRQYESFRNEWNYRDFWRKGQWLEFLKTSALDQLEASILGS